MRGWSGALPQENQSFPNLEDVRGALCQMQCPEGNKEIIDDLPLYVSPCILSTPVNLMQECDNKVVQKSASFILKLKLWSLKLVSVLDSELQKLHTHFTLMFENLQYLFIL